MAVSTSIPTITLNINQLNAPIRRHRVAEWIKKKDPYMLPTRDSSSLITHRLKVRGWALPGGTWIRTCLPRQGIRLIMVQEDSSCWGTAKLSSHNCWAQALGLTCRNSDLCAWSLCPAKWEATTMCRSPCSAMKSWVLLAAARKPTCSFLLHEEPTQTKTKQINYKQANKKVRVRKKVFLSKRNEEKARNNTYIRKKLT